MVHRALQSEPTMQPEQPIYVDPASGRRYGVDRSTGSTYWLADTDAEAHAEAHADTHTDTHTDVPADIPGPWPSQTGQPPTVDVFWPPHGSGPSAFAAQPGPRSGSASHGRSGRASTPKLFLIAGGSLAVLLVAVGVVGSLISPSPGPSTRAGSTLAAGGSATGQPATGQPATGQPAIEPPTTERPVVPATTPAAAPRSAIRTSAAPTSHSATSPRPATATAPRTTAPSSPKPPPAQVFANCKQLNAVYPHGVGRAGAVDHTTGKPVTDFTVNSSVYNANTARDRDGDGIACEKA